MILFPVRGDHVDKGSNIPVFPECRKHDENLSSIQGPLESQLHTQHVHDYNPPEYPSKRRDLQIYLFKRISFGLEDFFGLDSVFLKGVLPLP